MTTHEIMYETERKRYIPDEASLRRIGEQLLKLGYSVVQDGHETDTYFTRSDIDYMKTVECLRVRRRDDFAEITYKPPTNPDNSKDAITSKVEQNVRLASPDEAEKAVQLLSSIGMLPLAEVHKHRILYQNPEDQQTSVAIDSIKTVGRFIEVEVMDSSSQRATRKLEEVERSIGADSFLIATQPYRDMVIEAKR